MQNVNLQNGKIFAQNTSIGRDGIAKGKTQRRATSFAILDSTISLKGNKMLFHTNHGIYQADKNEPLQHLSLNANDKIKLELSFKDGELQGKILSLNKKNMKDPLTITLTSTKNEQSQKSSDPQKQTTVETRILSSFKSDVKIELASLDNKILSSHLVYFSLEQMIRSSILAQIVAVHQKALEDGAKVNLKVILNKKRSDAQNMVFVGMVLEENQEGSLIKSPFGLLQTDETLPPGESIEFELLAIDGKEISYAQDQDLSFLWSTLRKSHEVFANFYKYIDYNFLLNKNSEDGADSQKIISFDSLNKLSDATHRISQIVLYENLLDSYNINEWYEFLIPFFIAGDKQNLNVQIYKPNNSYSRFIIDLMLKDNKNIRFDGILKFQDPRGKITEFSLNVISEHKFEMIAQKKVLEVFKKAKDILQVKGDIFFTLS